VGGPREEVGSACEIKAVKFATVSGNVTPDSSLHSTQPPVFWVYPFDLSETSCEGPDRGVLQGQENCVPLVAATIAAFHPALDSEVWLDVHTADDCQRELTLLPMSYHPN